MNRRKFFIGAAAAALAPFALSVARQCGELPQDGVDWFTNVPVRHRTAGRCDSMTTS